MMHIDQLLESAEMAREKGNHAEALALAEQVIIAAADSGDYTRVVEALAHKLIIYKHKFQASNNQVFNVLMYGDVQAGLKIITEHNISGHPVAVMHMRAADYFFWRKEYSESIPFYEQALKHADKNKKGEYAEFLSHLGMAEIMAGKTDEGRQKVEQSLSLAEADNALRPFHKLTVTSGILFRLSASYGQQGNKEKFEEYFSRAMEQAQILKNEYTMPMRTIQGEALRQRMGI
jgi:tetratricopeptide (TPR) repeat protein